MKLETSSLSAKLAPLVEAARRYRVILFALFFLGLYGFLVMRITTLIESEPPDHVVSEKSKSIKRITVDKTSIDRLLKFESQNIEVQSLFDEARKSPFTEPN